MAGCVAPAWSSRASFSLSFFASARRRVPAPAQSLPRSPTHPPPPIPMAAARFSLRLRPPSRFLPPPAPLSRVFVPVCAQAQFRSRRGPRRLCRTASAAPRTPPPLLAGYPRTTPTLSPSPITHTPISIHLHPHNSVPHLPSSLSSSHPSHPRRDRARGRIWALSRFGSFLCLV